MAGFLPATPAWAHWSSSGSAQAMATTGTLRGPIDVTLAATATSEVTITWSTGVGDVDPLGFYVSRYSGSSTDAACGSSPADLVGPTSCTDLAVPDGDYTYVVTAVYRSWTERSASSEVITVLAPIEPETAPAMDQAASESTATPTPTAVDVTAAPEESASPSPTPGSGPTTPTPTPTPTPTATPTMVVDNTPSG